MENIEYIEEFKNKIINLQNLPTLPIIATEILRITREDKLSVNQILPIIEKDPPLAMKVLKIANSAYYGMRSKTKSLRHAIVVIGLSQLSNIALGFSVIKRYDNQSGNADWKKFWIHSIAVGYLSELIVEELELSIKDNPYILGLLHDIGKLAFNTLESEKFNEVLDIANKENLEHCIIEKRIFGVDHTQVGKWIAEKWKMGEILINTIADHHNLDVEDSQSKLCAAIINTADYICNYKNIRFGIDFDIKMQDDLEGWKYLQQTAYNIEDYKLKEFIDDIEDQLTSIIEMVELIQT